MVLVSVQLRVDVFQFKMQCVSVTEIEIWWWYIWIGVLFRKGTFKDLDITPLNLLRTPLICNVLSNLIFGRRKLKSRLALDAFVCWQSSLSPWFICFCKLHFPTNCSSLILDFFSDCHLFVLNLLLILIIPRVLIITSRLCVGRWEEAKGNQTNASISEDRLAYCSTGQQNISQYILWYIS